MVEFTSTVLTAGRCDESGDQASGVNGVGMSATYVDYHKGM